MGLVVAGGRNTRRSRRVSYLIAKWAHVHLYWMKLGGSLISWWINLFLYYFIRQFNNFVYNNSCSSATYYIVYIYVYIYVYRNFYYLVNLFYNNLVCINIFMPKNKFIWTLLLLNFLLDIQAYLAYEYPYMYIYIYIFF